MWNAESLPRQTHRSSHRRPQWPSRAALYTQKDTRTYSHICAWEYIQYSCTESLRHIEIGCTAARTHMRALVEIVMLSAPVEDVIYCNCSWPHRPVVIRDQVEVSFNCSSLQPWLANWDILVHKWALFRHVFITPCVCVCRRNIIMDHDSIVEMQGVVSYYSCDTCTHAKKICTCIDMRVYSYTQSEWLIYCRLDKHKTHSQIHWSSDSYAMHTHAKPTFDVLSRT